MSITNVVKHFKINIITSRNKMPIKSDKHRYSIDHIDLDKLILPFVVHTHIHTLYKLFKEKEQE